MDVEVRGRGPVRILALHGWFGASDGWGYLPELVDGDRFSVAFLDYRGYGRRRGESGDFSLAELTDDVLTAAQALGWRDYGLMGHSMGGVVALSVLRAAPERVLAIVGITPVSASGVPFDEDTRALFDSAAQSAESRRAILDFTTGGRLPGSWLDSMTAYTLANTTPEAVAGYLKAWADADFADDIPKFDGPAGAIVGEHDPALGVDVVRATWLEQLPGSSLAVVPNAGHYPMFEAPISLIKTIEEILPTS